VISKGPYKAILFLFLIGITLNAQVTEPLKKVKIDQKQEKQQALNDSIGKLSFHIVAGAFRNPDNAVKKMNQLKALGYNARVLGIDQAGLTKVSYGSYKNREDALYNLAKIKKTVDKDAWLFVEKSSSTETNLNEAVTEGDNMTKDKAVELQELDQPVKDVQSQAVEAKILVKNADGLIDINGVVENHDNIYIERCNFNLVVLKLDASGNYLKNAQSGEFSLQPNERKNLATLKVNIKESDVLKLYFFIRKDLKLIAKDTAIVVSKIKKLATKPIAEETIEINGLVVEDVITKLGKDFYDFFYQEYNSSGYKFPFVINIIEKPLIGISSEIRIDIDDRMVYKMTTRPNEEYLQAAARQAIVAINNYNEKRKFLFKKNIKF
jgi:uncharacterized protein YdeI (BOF family)